MSTTTRSTCISHEQIEEFSKFCEEEKNFSLLQNIINNVEVSKIVLNKSKIEKNPKYSKDLINDWKATDQKRSGRCWIFAATNVLRIGFMKKHEIKNFEFSQSYVAFWDKFERSNYFLEIAIQNRGVHYDDRTWQYCLTQVVNDGGQWDMVMGIIKKYGVVPKDCFDETISSSKTLQLKRHLKVILKNAANTLLKCKEEEIQKIKIDTMKLVFRLLVLHYGTPPKEFQLLLKDKTIKSTPKEFLEKYVGNTIIDEGISLIHDPREENQYNQLYTVKYLGNIWGENVTYLNVKMDDMIEYVKKTVAENVEPVFFGCDFGKSNDRESGTMDTSIFFFDELYGTKITLTKEDRLRLGETSMTHAMVIVGVDVSEKGEVLKMKVENSHGAKKGRDGFILMTTDWFREHNFQIVVRKSILSKEHKEIIEKKKYYKELEAWDPMGALAQ